MVENSDGEFIKKQEKWKFNDRKTLQLQSEEFKTWKQEGGTGPIGHKSTQ